MRWSAPRLFAVPGSGSSNPFLVGPDGPPDIRSRRPFFLLPILGARGTAARASVLRRIVTYIDAQTGPITDVIVLSHGWHRNFFSAMAAYDRIVARLANLIGRGAIQPPAAFNPLYIAVHWHSDPGENLWIDRDGRRSKREFLKNVREVFRPIDAAATENEMERDFELMFELLSSLSAPDIEATGPEVDDLARFLAETLDSRYDLRAAAGSELDRKVAVLWTCYTYAAPRKIVHPQSEAPGGFLGAFGGLRKLVGFLMSVVPLLTLVGLIVNLPVPRYSVRDVQFVLGPDGADRPQTLVRRGTVRDGAGQCWRDIGTAAMSMPVLEDLPAGLPMIPARAWVHLGAAAGLGLISLILLAAVGLWRSVFALNKPAAGIPWLAMIPWFYLQVLFSLPLLVISLIGLVLSGFGLGRLVQMVRLVSDERTGLRDRPESRTPALNVGWLLASIARMPILLLRRAVALDSRATGVADVIESQLAYYDMQRRGVRTGVELGEAIAELVRERPILGEAKLHFAGHSFGGLVVSNAARSLAFNASFSGSIRTVSLLNGAIASGWYDREPTLRARITGAVSAIYTRYDTANGFWYPLSSVGRLAAGSVGLSGDVEAEHHVMPPMLISPPLLNPVAGRGSGCRFLNVDASRIMYAGPPALGGAHGHIDRDDVLLTLWAAIQA